MFRKAMRKSKSIAGASFILASATVISGLLGIIRNRLLAGHFGAGSQLDIYFASLRIPDFLTTVLIMGSLSVAIIPLFNQYRSRSSEEGWQFISALFRWLAFFLILVAATLAILAPWLTKLLAPGFNLGQQGQMTLMVRIMLLSPIFLGFSMVISSVLQSLRHFWMSSLAPIFYNLGIIIGILWFVPYFGLMGLAWGVVLGSFLHLSVQLPAFFACHFRYQKFFAEERKAMREFLKLGLPRTLGVTASQINVLVMTALASALSAGSITVYNFSADISQSLTRLIGVSFTTAAFPILALNISRRERNKFLENFSSAFRQILYLVVPISLLVFILRAHLVRIFLGAGRFSWVDTRMTAACLGILSLSVFAQALVTLISKAFAALHNTKTPARITIGTVTLNILFSILFIHFLGGQGEAQEIMRSFLKLRGLADIRVVGLALAFSLATIVQLAWLLIRFRKEFDGWFTPLIKCSLVKIILAATIMTPVTYGGLYFLDNFINTTTFWGITAQATLAGLGGLFTYLFITWIVKSPELKDLGREIRLEFKKDA